MKATQTLDSSSFAEVIASSDKPVLVDFWAEWCGPCRAVAPILEEIAVEHADEIVVAKLNIDDHPDIARQYNIMSIPTMIVFKDGVAGQQLVGAKPKVTLVAELGL